jgi:hypothetical protein
MVICIAASGLRNSWPAMAISSSREASASVSARWTSPFSERTWTSASSRSMAGPSLARLPLLMKSSAPQRRTSMAAISPTLPETTMNGVPARSDDWTISSAWGAEKPGMLKSERMTSHGTWSASRSASVVCTRVHSTDQPARRRCRSTARASSSTSSTCSTRSGLIVVPTKASRLGSARSTDVRAPPIPSSTAGRTASGVPPGRRARKPCGQRAGIRSLSGTAPASTGG